MYFPQALQWLGELGSPIAVAFLERWPTLSDVQKSRPATIRKFYTSHNSRTGGDGLDKRIDEIQKAIPATHDEAVIAGYSVAVLAWTGLLKQLLLALRDYDQRIDLLGRKHPDYALMKSFPGVGPVTAPRLIAALGSQRDCSCCLQQWQETSCSLPLGLPSLSAAKRWTRGGRSD